MKIGTIVESLKLPLFDGLKKTAELGAEGVQIYAVARNSHNLLNYSSKQLKPESVKEFPDSLFC